jgi:hypothetical protein
MSLKRWASATCRCDVAGPTTTQVWHIQKESDKSSSTPPTSTLVTRSLIISLDNVFLIVDPRIFYPFRLFFLTNSFCLPLCLPLSQSFGNCIVCANAVQENLTVVRQHGPRISAPLASKRHSTSTVSTDEKRVNKSRDIRTIICRFVVLSFIQFA